MLRLLCDATDDVTCTNVAYNTASNREYNYGGGDGGDRGGGDGGGDGGRGGNGRVAHRPSRSTKSPVVSFLATARRLAESLLVTWLAACWSLGWKPVGHSDDADDNHDDDDDDNHDDDDVDAYDDADDEVHAGLVLLLVGLAYDDAVAKGSTDAALT